MSADVSCFLVERIDKCLRYLRVFRMNEQDRACPRGNWHSAWAYLDRVRFQLDANDCIGVVTWPLDDSRWPTHCACGEPFRADDYHQVWQEPLYRRVGAHGRAPWVLRGDLPAPAVMAPIGAMWYFDWSASMRGPDGHSLHVLLPDGTDWCVDGPSRSGGGWTRTGAPPHVTASPSIKSPRYHGHLVAGVLKPCSDSKT